jgi:hypothetical protein
LAEQNRKAECARVPTVSVNARNVGLARAIGAEALLKRGARWLAFIDADTLVSPSWLADQLSLDAGQKVLHDD